MRDQRPDRDEFRTFLLGDNRDFNVEMRFDREQGLGQLKRGDAEFVECGIRHQRRAVDAGFLRDDIQNLAYAGIGGKFSGQERA